jgi:hypothetical protein
MLAILGLVSFVGVTAAAAARFGVFSYCDEYKVFGRKVSVVLDEETTAIKID